MTNVGYFIDEQGKGNFKIFAPLCDSLAVELDLSHERINLTKQPDGYFTAQIDPLVPGTLYWLVKNDHEYLPDPYSKLQPFDVHSASQIVDIKKANSEGWKGINIKDAVIYELHLGTFSEEGNLKGAKEKLTYLRSLGINVIELMPICEFPGERNWGYDGTYMFALDQSYGSYDDLKNFIEEAHKMGIAVILDIVYNHFGPEGNYSGMLAPFTKEADTPWGAAVNYDQGWSIGIRDFYLANTKHWIADVGFDGFRMDAVALVLDSSPKHILTEINELVDQISNNEHREIIMIAEHLRNEAHVVSDDGYKFDAQWVDDLNYALYSYLTPDRFRHYRDFGSIEDVIKAIEKGFVYDGTKHNTVYDNYMGCDGTTISPEKFVVHIQNHDQIGNRPNGDRMSKTYGIDKALLATTIIFASPYTPLLFMGEEYAEMNPFLFFESFKDKHLIEAVREGRKREFSFEPNFEPKSPHDVQTFIDSKIDWELQSDTPHNLVLEFYKKIIALKKQNIIGQHDRSQIKVSYDSNTKVLVIESSKSYTVCNMSDEKVAIPECYKDKKVILSSKIENDSVDSLDKFTAKIFAK